PAPSARPVRAGGAGCRPRCRGRPVLTGPGQGAPGQGAPTQGEQGAPRSTRPQPEAGVTSGTPRGGSVHAQRGCTDHSRRTPTHWGSASSKLAPAVAGSTPSRAATTWAAAKAPATWASSDSWGAGSRRPREHSWAATSGQSGSTSVMLSATQPRHGPRSLRTNG